MTAPTEKQNKVWFVLDELASLQRLPQLHTAITESRKSNNPIILGLQGKAQLEDIYRPLLAQVMLSQPATKIFLKTTEPNAAEWISNAIGKVEIERVKETHSQGTRSGKSFTVDRQVEPLVMDSEISGLEDKHAFLEASETTSRDSTFDYVEIPQNYSGVSCRAGWRNDELEFDPKTLQPKPRKPQAATEKASSKAKAKKPAAAKDASDEARDKRTKTYAQAGWSESRESRQGRAAGAAGSDGTTGPRPGYAAVC